MDTLKYPGKSEDYCLSLPDHLNKYDEEVSLFLKGGHYDIIYPHGDPAVNYAGPFEEPKHIESTTESRVNCNPFGSSE